ncbi:MAG: DUF2817 domain-containing protein [Comamonadaceae bacterium]|nr:MAG: DUF2817 domain-containing protein [Comamonadaceae bacterium]
MAVLCHTDRRDSFKLRGNLSTAAALISRRPPELDELERVITLGGRHFGVESFTPDSTDLPIHTITLGNPAARAAVGIFGGVHGLERIGSQVVIAFLHSLAMRLQWDDSLHRLLDDVRVVFMPIVNPEGMRRHTRANPRGVDLMRNAPVESREPVPLLLGGHRISAALPWFRGRAGEAMEAESTALCHLVERELHGRAFSLALDCHSGFGMQDRIWFPYAHRRTPIPHLEHLYALHEIFSHSNNQHRYIFEPQSRQYLTHGDLWDHLYLRAGERAAKAHDEVFLPLTLEMGSWLWVKKNPRQLFSRHGIFNPLIAHRQQRVLRGHLPLLDFALRAAGSWRNWLPQGEARAAHRRLALTKWYGAAA